MFQNYEMAPAQGLQLRGFKIDLISHTQCKNVFQTQKKNRSTKTIMEGQHQ
jgi:hypothetical protein